ncbi:hypothetical protein CBG60_07765 [Fusobacterium animalis]|nr:hypothetical protein CBG60_07765 [Fusobacterium animalis]
MEQENIFYRFLLYIRIKNEIISKFISIIEKRGYYKTLIASGKNYFNLISNPKLFLITSSGYFLSSFLFSSIFSFC